MTTTTEPAFEFRLPAIGEAGQELFDQLEGEAHTGAVFEIVGIEHPIGFGKLVHLNDRLRELGLTMRGRVLGL